MQISKCRLCKGSLDPVISLGNQYVSDFPKPGVQGFKSPLDLVKCTNCHLVQLETSVDSDKLFSHFWYESAISKTMRTELGNIAFEAMKTASGSLKGHVFLDIGCNDGTLLRQYPTTMTKVGFEPAINVAVKAQSSGHIFTHYFESWRYLQFFTPAKIITTIAMFYDLEDPNKFVRELADCLLKDKGIWVNQMNYLPSMLENNCYDNICHEHLEYYTLTSLSMLIEKYGLEVFKVEKNPVNGGSFRVYAAHAGQYKVEPSVPSMLVEEASMGLETLNPYRAFQARIEELRRQLMAFLERVVILGHRKVFAYGASTRGNTLLQYCNLHNGIVQKACDLNPEKWGRVTVGTNIPIISKMEMQKEKPDYLLVLPYHLLDEIRTQERDYLLHGGRLIVPLPSFQVIS